MTTLIGRAGLRRTAPLFLLSAAANGVRWLRRRIVEEYRVTRTRRMLMGLDQRTLRDLGLSRTDIEQL
jgi:uncharacterized protein YjiS (DUF1127 family)